MRMRNLMIPVLAGLTLAYAMLAQAQLGGGLTPMPPVPGSLPAHRFERVSEGVYYATSTGSINLVSNSAVVVNDEDVLVVDPGVTPAAARSLVEDLKTITSKPIKYVVDTHAHFDHAFGNQVFGTDVTLIGHAMARRRLMGQMGNVLQQQTYLSNVIVPLAPRIAQLKEQLAAEKDPHQRTVLGRQLGVQQAFSDAQKEIRPTPPNTTLSSDLTLHRGRREIQIRHLGRGHTDGDVVVFLPQERIVITGDMITSALSFPGDAYMDEWPATLARIAALDFDTVLGGHGVVFKGKDHFRNMGAYWTDFYQQALSFQKQGVPAEEAARRIDLTKHSGVIPAAKTPGVDVRGVHRIYDLAANPNAPVR
jgi:cyclase